MRDYIISSVQETNLTNKNGVYQDSLIAYDRDASGRIWAILGHTNLGGISVWSGESLCRLQKKYPAEFLFSLGEAGAAFNASTYPDGPLSRGQIWPCGLWIHPDTNRFYCFIHNETGWGAGTSSYTATGFAEGEPDFRHIGMMYEKNAALQADNARLQGKAVYYDLFIDLRHSTNLRTTAKELEVPERRFVRFLLERRYVYRAPSGCVLPYAKSANEGLFCVKDFCRNGHTGSYTLVTPKGKLHFAGLRDLILVTV